MIGALHKRRSFVSVCFRFPTFPQHRPHAQRTWRTLSAGTRPTTFNQRSDKSVHGSAARRPHVQVAAPPRVDHDGETSSEPESSSKTGLRSDPSKRGPRVLGRRAGPVLTDFFIKPVQSPSAGCYTERRFRKRFLVSVLTRHHLTGVPTVTSQVHSQLRPGRPHFLLVVLCCELKVEDVFAACLTSE